MRNTGFIPNDVSQVPWARVLVLNCPEPVHITKWPISTVTMLVWLSCEGGVEPCIHLASFGPTASKMSFAWHIKEYHSCIPGKTMSRQKETEVRLIDHCKCRKWRHSVPLNIWLRSNWIVNYHIELEFGQADVCCTFSSRRMYLSTAMSWFMTFRILCNGSGAST